MTRKCLIAAVLLFVAMPVTAQYRSRQFDARPPIVVPLSFQQANESGVRPVIGGVLGGVVGLAAGGALGIALANRDGDDYAGLFGWLLGAWLGEAAGVALGVHVNTQRRGNVPAEILAAASISAAGLLLGPELDMPAAFLVFAIPITQIAVVVGMERRAQ